MNLMKKFVWALLAVALLVLCSFCGGEEMPQTPPAVVVTEAPTSRQPILVNAWNPIPNSYNAELQQLDNGQSVAAECYDELTKMLSDCETAGHHPVVISGYRSIAYQAQLFENKIGRVIQEGHSRRKAEQIAAMEVARPATSEHHTGLAVDIVDASNYALDETQADTPTQQWLMEHCWDYGFILRYPEDKTEHTGIIYEPWHYRYVGTDIAGQLHDSGECLEEYLAG